MIRVNPNSLLPPNHHNQTYYPFSLNQPSLGYTPIPNQQPVVSNPFFGFDQQLALLAQQVMTQASQQVNPSNHANSPSLGAVPDFSVDPIANNTAQNVATPVGNGLSQLDQNSQNNQFQANTQTPLANTLVQIQQLEAELFQNTSRTNNLQPSGFNAMQSSSALLNSLANINNSTHSLFGNGVNQSFPQSSGPVQGQMMESAQQQQQTTLILHLLSAILQAVAENPQYNAQMTQNQIPRW